MAVAVAAAGGPQGPAQTHFDHELLRRSKSTCKPKAPQQPFDAAELVRRLEYYRQEQKLASLRADHREDISTNRQSALYLPRYSARALQASTDVVDQPKRNHDDRRDSGHVKATPGSRLQWTDHPVSLVNPKQMLVAKLSGMTETEAIAACTHMTSVVSHVEPNNAPSRQASKRRSQVVPPELRNLAANELARPRRWSTALEDLELAPPPYRQNPYMLDLPTTDEALETENRNTLLKRPVIQPHDRNDWAQASQCGEPARLHLRLPRSSNRQGPVKEEQATQQPSRTLQRPGMKSRPKSCGDVRGARLVADASAPVKKEQKPRRRLSFWSLFRRSK